MTILYYKEYTMRENPEQTIQIADFEWINNAKEDYEAMVKHFKEEVEFWKKKGFDNNGFQVKMITVEADADFQIPNQATLMTASWDDAAECWVRNIKSVKLVED